MQHNLEQQIQARNQSGVSEDALKEFSMMFKYVVFFPFLLLFRKLNFLLYRHRHFDKERTGRLNHQEFKSCLRALGYDLPMVEEGQVDPEFETILGKDRVDFFHSLSRMYNEYVCTDVVDPNRDGFVSLQEYMAFMISKETENVQSSEEIENAFRAITNGERPYVTKEELYAVSVHIFFFSSLPFAVIA